MTTTAYYRDSKARRRLYQGPLGIHIDRYAARLLSEGHCYQGGARCLRVVSDFSRWLERKRLDVCDVDDIPPERKTVITSPDTQLWLIDNLYSRYLKLGDLTKGDYQEKDADLFKDFIIQSYHGISTEFKCDRVSFWFDVKDNNIEVLAQPNR